jgi:hypothetical protein
MQLTAALHIPVRTSLAWLSRRTLFPLACVLFWILNKQTDAAHLVL